MNSIGEFFKKHKIFVKNNEEVKNKVLEVLNQFLKNKIDENNIKIKGKMLILNVSPIEKQEVFLNRENILNLINKESNLISKIN